MTDPIHRLNVRIVPVASVKPERRNPRTHSPKQIEQIASSIRQFGFTLPILIDAKGALSPAMHGSRRQGYLTSSMFQRFASTI
jgi:ParB-like nuclease domain